MDKWTIRCIGVALVSIASLMLQVTYTRVFSITLWYHFVWMIVSIALLGFAVSGTFLMMFQGFSKIDIDNLLSLTSGLFSVSILITYRVSNQVPFDPASLAWDNMQLIYLLVYYVLLAIPFFLSGMTTAIAIERSDSRVNTVYFSSFLGSAIGSIFVLPFFNYLGGSGVLVFTSLIGGLGALIFTINLKKRTKLIMGWIFLLILLLPYSSTIIPVKVSPYKSLNIALRYQNAELLETQWNSFSRIDVVDSGYIRYAPGLSLSYTETLPHQLGVIVDGDEVNAITSYNGNPSTLTFTSYLPSYVPYHLLENPKVLVVNAGGGLGVLSALHGNSSQIIVTEENPNIINLVKDSYSGFSGNIYLDPRVDIEVSDGRSYIQNSKNEYDLIDLSQIGSASTSTTGIYALSENYIYTEEAFISFFEHLSPTGILSVQRGLLPPPREDVRIVSLAISSLTKNGISNPEEHIVVFRSLGTLNLLVGKKPFNHQQLSLIRHYCSEMGFDIVYVDGVDPGEANKYNQFPDPIYYNIVNEIIRNKQDFYDNYLFDISPTTDEKPFFFNFFKWNRVTETYNNLDKRWQPLIEGGFLIHLVLVQALILSTVFVLLPLHRMENDSYKENSTYLLYFFLIGVGYMFIEITTIQSFILILGNTIYSISTVLFGLLLFSGIGSYYSGKIKPGTKNHVIILGAIGGISILFGLISPKVHLVLGLSFPLRVFFTLFIVGPMGFLMGIPFPLGIRLLSRSNKELINWAWAINGCSSVIGTILPIIVALYFGFSRVYLLAGITYLLTILIIIKSENKFLSE